ncbi:MAG: HAD family hydrolase [Deltaproteobacteria bacterium]|nr:HAD family hydrolase [Deltaproteobacteria bacterium]
MWRNIQHILWDWNGTLLNDFPTCHGIVNTLAGEWGIEPVDVELCREKFRHPVEEFYRDLGFDFSERGYNELLRSFITHYSKESSTIGLHEGAEEALRWFHSGGYSQQILSAYPHDAIEESIAPHGIRHYFREVWGAGDAGGVGKLELGRALFRHLGYSPAETVLIGDTDHDAEVARALGVECILVPNGHQAHSVIARQGFPVAGSLAEALALFRPHRVAAA